MTENERVGKKIRTIAGKLAKALNKAHKYWDPDIKHGMDVSLVVNGVSLGYVAIDDLQSLADSALTPRPDKQK